MALRKNQGSKKKALSKNFIFWLAFFIVIALLFLINIPKIMRTVENVAERRSGAPAAAETGGVVLEPERTGGGAETPESSSISVEGAAAGGVAGGGIESPAQEQFPPAGGAAEDSRFDESGGLERGGLSPPSQTGGISASEGVQTAQTIQKDTRERTIYLVRVDSSGGVYILPSKRMIAADNTPLISTLNLLLRGPTEDEKSAGLMTLIPQGTRVLGARVDGARALINFNEAFMFNSFGAEGYDAQLRQIIWTTTEFQNINEVEIQIDGKRPEFLGETVRIDRPLGRHSF